MKPIKRWQVLVLVSIPAFVLAVDVYLIKGFFPLEWRLATSPGARIYRIDGRVDQKPTNQPALAGFPILSEGRLSPMDSMIARLIVAGKLVLPVPSLKLCLPEPGVAISLGPVNDPTNIAFCFECNIFMLESHGKRYAFDFDGERFPLRRIARESFPGDAAIRAIGMDSRDYFRAGMTALFFSVIGFIGLAPIFLRQFLKR